MVLPISLSSVFHSHELHGKDLKKNDILWIRLVSFIYEGNTVFVNVQAIQVS